MPRREEGRDGANLALVLVDHLLLDLVANLVPHHWALRHHVDLVATLLVVLEGAMKLERLDALHIPVVCVNLLVLVANVEVGVRAVKGVAMLSGGATRVSVGLESTRRARSSCPSRLVVASWADVGVHFKV